MRCPWPGCSGLRHKVISKALTAGGDLDKRRVECLTCGRRFTTRESVDLRLLRRDLFRLEEAAASGALSQSGGLETIKREPSRNSIPSSVEPIHVKPGSVGKPRIGVSSRESRSLIRPEPLAAARELRAKGEPPDGICRPHWERAGIRVPAIKLVAGTAMCRECWAGVSFRDEELILART
jgi:hypothetical protein